MVAPIHIDKYFLSCDWGTTSFRLKFVDAKSGHTIGEITDNEGIKTVHKLWAEYTSTMNRIDFYLSVLRKKIEALETKLQVDLSHYPIIISGMASSSIGIKELPYGSLPIPVKNPNLHVEKLPDNHLLSQDIYLISGLRTSNDVMRGEETQLIGLDYKYNLDTGTYLLAGTHSKHVYIKNRNIVGFKTFITGELFDLISTQSILSQSVSTHENAPISQDFEMGVQQSVNENLLHAFFEVRTRDLLQGIEHELNSDYLSGLLIGTELSDLAKKGPQQIIIYGNSTLQKRYYRACTLLKLNVNSVESDPKEDLTALGQRIILQQIIN